ncbi:hypothetical protein MMC19_004319 [Ptychographa xylographoides]|nr:hypothetical protein [Ptychographa xylographoides]
MIVALGPNPPVPVGIKVVFPATIIVPTETVEVIVVEFWGIIATTEIEVVTVEVACVEVRELGVERLGTVESKIDTVVEPPVGITNGAESDVEEDMEEKEDEDLMVGSGLELTVDIGVEDDDVEDGIAVELGLDAVVELGVTLLGVTIGNAVSVGLKRVPVVVVVVVELTTEVMLVGLTFTPPTLGLHES